MAKARTSPAGNRRPPGFTILELMVVLLVLGAAAAVALPRLEGAIPGLKLRQTARELVVMLREGQRQAIAGGRDVAVTLDLPGRTAHGPGLATVSLDRRFDVALTTASLIGEGRDAGEVVFFPDGTSTGAELRLGYGARRYVVRVDWQTGRAVLSDE